jgi:hypothetical protein
LMLLDRVKIASYVYITPLFVLWNSMIFPIYVFQTGTKYWPKVLPCCQINILIDLVCDAYYYMINYSVCIYNCFDEAISIYPQSQNEWHTSPFWKTKCINTREKIIFLLK